MVSNAINKKAKLQLLVIYQLVSTAVEIVVHHVSCVTCVGLGCHVSQIYGVSGLELSIR